MSKPTNTFRWATVAGTQIVNPVSGKKDVGFNADEEPAAQLFNAKWNNDYQWNIWLDGITPAGSASGYVIIDSSGNLSTLDYPTTEDAVGSLRHATQPVSVAPIGQFTNCNYSSSGYATATSAGATLEVPLQLTPGKNLNGFGAKIYGTGSGNITIRLYKSNGTTNTNVATAIATNPTAAWVSLTTSFSDYLIDADYHFLLTVEMASSGARVAALYFEESYSG